MKKLIVMLAAALTFKKGQTVSVDAAVADDLIAKGHAAEVDQSLLQRDHATPPSSDEAIVRAISAGLKPMQDTVKALEQKVNDLAPAPRKAATKNVGDVRAEVEEPAQQDPDAAPEVTLRDVVSEIRRGHAAREGTAGIEFRGREVEEGTGLKLARYVRASVAAQHLGVTPDVVLGKWGYPQMARQVRDLRDAVLKGFGVEKGLTQGTFADGGALVPEQFSAELVPLLRNATAVRRAGARVITMNGGNLTLPKQTGASSATYVGEVSVDTPSKPALGALRFSEKKMRVGVVLSNDLIQNAALSADAWVRDDMVKVAAIKEDLTALFGTGSQYSPTGIENLLTSTRKIDSTCVDRTAPTLAETRKELSRIIKLVKQSNVVGPTSKLAWIMNARFESFLMGLTESTGAVPAYLDQLDRGMLRGYPVFVTEQIPDNLASFAAANSDETRVFFGDFDTFVIAESGGGMQVKVFPDGTYEEGGQVYSGASRDQTYVRLILKHDFNMRYDNTIVDSSHRPA